MYSAPQAAKVAHIKAHSHVSLNLDSDGDGGGVVAAQHFLHETTSATRCTQCAGHSLAQMPQPLQ